MGVIWLEIILFKKMRKLRVYKKFFIGMFKEEKKFIFEFDIKEKF